MANQHLDILAQEAARYASQIASLATIANCMVSGSHPADPVENETIVLNILDVIADLAGRAEHAAEAIETATHERKTS